MDKTAMPADVKAGMKISVYQGSQYVTFTVSADAQKIGNGRTYAIGVSTGQTLVVPASDSLKLEA